MAHWHLWLIACALVAGLEMLTGTFYLLMISAGLGAGALAAGLGASEPAQGLIAAAVCALAVTALRKSKWGGRAPKLPPGSDPAQALDIGQQVQVIAWSSDGPGARGRALYRGSHWDVELQSGEAIAGYFTICETRGSTLLVR